MLLIFAFSLGLRLLEVWLALFRFHSFKVACCSLAKDVNAQLQSQLNCWPFMTSWSQLQIQCLQFESGGAVHISMSTHNTGSWIYLRLLSGLGPGIIQPVKEYITLLKYKVCTSSSIPRLHGSQVRLTPKSCWTSWRFKKLVICIGAYAYSVCVCIIRTLLSLVSNKEYEVCIGGKLKCPICIRIYCHEYCSLIGP